MNACRVCGGAKLVPGLDLGLHPCADTFLTKSATAQKLNYYPLRTRVCTECSHMQNEVAVPGDERYCVTDYSYTTGNSIVSRDHFQSLARTVIEFCKLGPRDSVVDIGSNDGTLLTSFRDQSGCAILGVDPAANIARIAVERGVPTLVSFFGPAIVEKCTERQRPSVIIGTNVLNHSDAPVVFFETAAKIVAPDGVIVVEIPYLGDLVGQCAFDTVYHEHVNYFSIQSLAAAARIAGLALLKVDKIDYMGGSLRAFLAPAKARQMDLAPLLAGEAGQRLGSEPTYRAFQEKVLRIKIELMSMLYRAKQEKGFVIGVGAATKGNTLLNFCKIDKTLLEFIIDSSPYKIGKYTPGGEIPILADSEFDDRVTHALLLPWNIADYLLRKFADKKARFLIPLKGVGLEKNH